MPLGVTRPDIVVAGETSRKVSDVHLELVLYYLLSVLKRYSAYKLYTYTNIYIYINTEESLGISGLYFTSIPRMAKKDY